MLRPGREPGFVSNCGREIRFALRENTVIIGGRSDGSFYKRARARATPVVVPRARYVGRTAPGCPGYTDDRLLQKLDSRCDGKRNIWDSSAGRVRGTSLEIFLETFSRRIPLDSIRSKFNSDIPEEMNRKSSETRNFVSASRKIARTNFLR